jgi:xanthine dehydrogenase YagR molybdenum-binding subunit
MFQGGSSMTNSTGVAIVMVAKALKEKLLKKAKDMPSTPLAGVAEKDVASSTQSEIKPKAKHLD